MTSKKVFITGGLGFIGHRIVKKLLEENYKVLVYDLSYTYTDPVETNFSKVMKLRIDELKENFELVKGDIRNEFYLYETLDKFKPDTFVHLAAIPIVAIASKYPEDALQNNLNGTISALNSIHRAGSVKHFIYTSSSTVYGDFISETVDENHPTNPIELYATTKLCGEIFAKTFQKMYGINYTIVRPSAVNGFGAINKSVLQLFCQQALQGKPLTLKGSEDIKLDFTHVDDLAEAYVLMIKNKNSLNQTFNITKGKANTLKVLISILKEKFPNISIKKENEDIKMPKRGTLDISKARKLLGFEPKYDLRDCVESYLEFYKKVIE